uniref:Uncharacterized protein n=1 Tax=Arundo donax TaxID=35708 RepID=A0A0A9C9Z6_ARUDO
MLLFSPSVWPHATLLHVQNLTSPTERAQKKKELGGPLVSELY